MKKNFKWPQWPQYNKICERLVSEVVKSNRIFNGPKVKEFEKNFRKYNGSNFAVAVGNGTQALHLALAAANIGHNDEVIVTPRSYYSSAACIIQSNGKPVLVGIASHDFRDVQKEVEYIRDLISVSSKKSQNSSC